MSDSNRDDFAEWSMEADEGVYFLLDATGSPWIAFGTEDGEWYATRPPHEDDHADAHGKGVTASVETLDFPVIFAATIAAALGALAGVGILYLIAWAIYGRHR